MNFSKVYSAQTILMNAKRVDVEVDISKGLHKFTIVGLTDKAIDESKERVCAAIKHSGFKSPKQKNEKVTIFLAPADLRKHGPTFDVAIALSYLQACKDIRFDAKRSMFFGELALDGSIRGISGILPLVRFAKENGFTEVFVPQENAREAALIEGIDVYGAASLRQVIDHINTLKPKSTSTNQTHEEPEPPPKIPVQEKTEIRTSPTETTTSKRGSYCISHIKGQEQAKRGLEIAAAGGHNIAFFGPPGTGKTMLAQSFQSILPSLSREAVLDVTSIHSVSGFLESDLITEPPFRAPHHTSSYVSLVGGSAVPKPGEVTLAHKGVLFLDEFPEFDRRVIDALRQPLENKKVTISRSKGTMTFPAEFILIAALNPCPCGYFGSNHKACICNPQSVINYQRKISGPIIDRIDMWIEVGQIKHEKLLEKCNSDNETSEKVQKRVVAARTQQYKRKKAKLNSQLKAKDIESFILLSSEIKEILNQAASKLELSARSYHNTIKLARTIADLEKSETIETKHMFEALQYRQKNWSHTN